MKTNKPKPPVFTHEGGRATHCTQLEELQRTVLTCLLWEDTFYEGGDSAASRIARLVEQVPMADAAELACTARSEMQLRHAPLHIVRELARRKGSGPIVEQTLSHIIQRADELAEFVALYWKDKKQPLSAGVKRGLAAAFTKFNEYQLAKYDRAGAVRLRDVMFLVHPKPVSPEQAELWKRLANNELATPDTWEVALSAGANKRETFKRLMKEGKLGGMAVLRNLRNMQLAGVDETLIRERLSHGVARALPFRFITAARYAPQLEDALEQAMFAGLADLPELPGRTGLLVDMSGSMNATLSARGETTRVDVAAGLAVLAREKCAETHIATFSSQVVIVPPRRGFALRDAIQQSQPHSSTYLRKALEALQPVWGAYDRIIVITDEQSNDGCCNAYTPNAYIINVAPYQRGVSYRNGWTHIDGWSERVLDYIMQCEQQQQQ